MHTAIDALLKESESETLEFKSNRSIFEDLARAACAMLNQRGGLVVWGISDAHHVSGVESAAERAEELKRFLMQSLNPRPLLSVSVEEQEGKQLVAIEVAQGTEKPYSFRREIWVRVGTKTLRASENDSAEMVVQSAGRLSRWEREPATGFSANECDREELRTTRDEIAESGRFGIDIPSDDEGFLETLYLSRSGQLSNAATVLFAKDPARWFPNMELRLVVYEDEEGRVIANDLKISGPAVRVVKETITAIQRRTGFSERASPASVLRHDEPVYPLFALREGMVNAVVHRDYEKAGRGVLVEIFPDRLRISNPGELPPGWSVDDILDRHESHPANPDIARVFYLRRLMEQLGLGAQRIKVACDEVGAPGPKWEASLGVVSLTLQPGRSTGRLSKRQSQFLVKMGTKNFKAGDYVRLAKVSERQARRDLAELEEIGSIVRQGAGPNTAYQLKPDPQRRIRP